MFHKNYFALVFGFLFLTATFDTAQAQSQFGRYLGVLKHTQIDQDQLAKLDFVISRQNSSEFKLIALLTLYFGDYESREYVTYHFDSVTYNILTGTLVFAQPDQEVTLIVERFANGRFSGSLNSVSAVAVGILEMTQDGSATPTRELVQPLWGEYRGVCDDIKTVMQVQTSRSSGDNSGLGNPFGTFEISAQIAEVDPGACLDAGMLCVTRVYQSGSYNFFKGSLDLQGRPRNVSCKVTASGMECEKCSLRRTSDEGVALGKKVFPLHQGGYSVPSPGGGQPAASDPPVSLGGTYYGYLFHESLGIYQPVSLNIVTYQGTGTNGGTALFVSATSAMFFGDFNSPEYVTHRFNEREFAILTPQILLERIDGGVDAAIQLTQLGNGKARGTWYSILFGRVGTFELSNVGHPPSPTDAPIMAPVSGRYESGTWSADISAVRQSTPINSVNPFYPLNFKGSFRLGELTPNIRIADGAYDFYTGKLNMRLENDTLFTGFRLRGASMSLKRPTPGIFRPLIPHQLQLFGKVSP